MSDHVLQRSLYFATEAAPKGLGLIGLGSMQDGSVQLPFQVSAAGAYRLILSYALAIDRRVIDIEVDGKAPTAAWSNVELWPTAPDYPWGSSHLYSDEMPKAADWVISDAVNLSAGAHTIRLTFHKGDIVITGAALTMGPVPDNRPKPWFQAGYIAFPALVFSNRVVEQTVNGMRITFNGEWYNLASDTVTYTLSTSVMLRDGAANTRFKVVSVSPADKLQLKLNDHIPFSLVVESDQPVPPTYSEMIRLDLASQDIPNLTKPYLMVASNGYVDLKSDTPFSYNTIGADDGKATLADNADMRHVIPTRETLGFQNGRYQRNLSEAFVYALASAPQPILTKLDKNGNPGGIDLTAWAKSSPTQWFNRPCNCWVTFHWDRDNPLAAVLAAQGQEAASIPNLREMILLLSDELPFYPVNRWDTYAPQILPTIFSERAGSVLMASYIKLVQQHAISDDEQFRFLHNVLLPLYLGFRDDLRIGGTLADNVKAGSSELTLTRPTAPNIFPEELIGSWIRVGTGDTTEYVQVSQELGNGKIRLNPNFPGPFKFDHTAGEPWVSYDLEEGVGLDGFDTWSFVAAAAASRDAAVIEQCMDFLRTNFETQNIFREDGSFANEPGSYGWEAMNYLEQINQAQNYFGRDTLNLTEDFKTRILNALIMWNEFPFSDGTYPMLNRGGSTNQLPRLDSTFNMLVALFPDRTDLIDRYKKIINQENNRAPGSYVDNKSFKVDGWGYAMLRGPGPWDKRMETLLSSKHLLYNPGDHVSHDTLGIVIFANGAIMTPRYGYDWRCCPFPLLNMVRIDHAEPAYWGNFLHFDGDPNMPSSVAYTDMAESFSTKPGLAHQERWLVQLPEYLFDTYIVASTDGKNHTYEWAYRNLGEVAITNPTSVPLRNATNADGSKWDPFGYYIQNTGHTGKELTTSNLWQADWTMNQGNIRFADDYPDPPKGAKMRVTMEGAPNTNVILAWLDGPRFNNDLLRQDFVVAERSGFSATFVSTYEPLNPGQQALVQSFQTVTEDTVDGSRVVKVVTSQGVDWFLVGTKDFSSQRPVRQIGPFKTDAALAVVRVRDNKVTTWMFAGGTTLEFADDQVSLETHQTHPAS